MIRISVDIHAFLVTSYFIIFFDHHVIPQLWVYKMHPRFFLCQKFPSRCFLLVFQWGDGRRNRHQKLRIGSLSQVFSCQVWTINLLKKIDTGITYQLDYARIFQNRHQYQVENAEIIQNRYR